MHLPPLLLREQTRPNNSKPSALSLLSSQWPVTVTRKSFSHYHCREDKTNKSEDAFSVDLSPRSAPVKSTGRSRVLDAQSLFP